MNLRLAEGWVGSWLTGRMGISVTLQLGFMGLGNKAVSLTSHLIAVRLVVLINPLLTFS